MFGRGCIVSLGALTNRRASCVSALRCVKWFADKLFPGAASLAELGRVYRTSERVCRLLSTLYSLSTPCTYYCVHATCTQEAYTNFERIRTGSVANFRDREEQYFHTLM